MVDAMTACEAGEVIELVLLALVILGTLSIGVVIFKVMTHGK